MTIETYELGGCQPWRYMTTTHGQNAYFDSPDGWELHWVLVSPSGFVICIWRQRA